MKKFVAFMIALVFIFTAASSIPVKAGTTQEIGTPTDYKVIGYPDIKIYKSNVKIYIEGKLVDFEEMYKRPVIIIKGRIMLPARAFTYYVTNTPVNPTPKEEKVHFYPNMPFKTDLEKLRRTDNLKSATWIEMNYPIPGTNDLLTAQVLQNFQYAIVYYKKNGSPYSGRDDYKTYKMDIPPLITDIGGGTTYLPLRMQAYLFGYGVKFDEKNNAVYISKKIPVEFGNGIEEVKNEPQYQDQYVGEYAIFYPGYGYLYQNGQAIELYPWDGK
ncbi:Copper amine oxidase N-terminal domain-containing protein [Thermoanaerobacter thermohydrosulfuricus]|uniref:Copper amine oxidase N-terminal domain-containing protein n=1 Tax=Thermoanaerobacter thermohydrosulfuricus TaxID=1516 RepID=A0A1G7SXM7_THETY|nr:stalk domain-containing protein [Thermoanaerobacter thermohydrosulfuricus]SDG27708.1 Copper amine oxidase N-terminal domain-containing protein [Thermoanaerobacter thermohydrosulfuricus]